MDEKKDVTGESSNTATNEKKGVKAKFNDFVEKKGKKKCIIIGSATGACALALILGLSIGLGGCSNKNAKTTVDATTWKARADEISAKHESEDFKAPSKMRFDLSTSEKYEYSDNATFVRKDTGFFELDLDKLAYHSKGAYTYSASGSEGAISSHAPSITEDVTDECWFWFDNVDSFYYVGQEIRGGKTTTKCAKYVATAEEISALKADPDSELYEMEDDVYDKFYDAFNKDLPYISRGAISITAKELSCYMPLSYFYDAYYADLSTKGTAEISNGDYTGEYTKKSLDFYSSGSGNAEFDFVGTVDAEQKGYSAAATDEVTHAKGTYEVSVGYDNYNWTSYKIKDEMEVNLTFDLTRKDTLSMDYGVTFSPNISLPTPVDPLIITLN